MLARLRILFLAALVFPSLSSALMVAGGLGLGSTTMKNEATETEGPFVQVYTVERLFHSRLALGVEHIRSLKGNMTSSASYTGIMGRYYLNAGPMAVINAEETSTEVNPVRDYCFFVGIGVGNSQSSRLPNSVRLSSNAAGFYVSPRAGVDYQLGKHLGARGEFVFAQSVFGSGSMATMSLSAGLYWLF